MKYLRLFNSLFITEIKFLLIKLLYPKKFSYSPFFIISPSIIIDIQGKKSKINFGKNTRINKNVSIAVRENGQVLLRKNVFINKNCEIVCHKKITIGENSYIGPNTLFYDHDHEITPNGVARKKFISKEIEVGKNVWIGANCIILKGSKIGDGAVIGAGSIVSGEIPPKTILIQKRQNTLKEIG